MRALFALTAAMMATAGCASQGRTAAEAQLTAQSAGAASAQSGGGASGGSAKSGNLQEDELQSRKDKLLVVTFVALLQLDKKPELGITADEAQTMLPIVKQSKELGELSANDQKALDKALTPNQAKFVADFRSRVDSRHRSRPELTPEQRDAMIAKFKERRSHEHDRNGTGAADGAAAADSSGGSAGNSATAGHGESPVTDTSRAGSAKIGADQTVEQQLIDLLQSKLNAQAHKSTLSTNNAG